MCAFSGALDVAHSARVGVVDFAGGVASAEILLGNRAAMG
jgi:hypothetical protein